MSVLSTSPEVPVPGTRRARRLAVTAVPETSAPVSEEAAAPLTRRELRLARQAAARPSAITAVTASDLVAAAGPAPVLDAEAVADAVAAASPSFAAVETASAPAPAAKVDAAGAANQDASAVAGADISLVAAHSAPLEPSSASPVPVDSADEAALATPIGYVAYPSRRALRHARQAGVVTESLAGGLEAAEQAAPEQVAPEHAPRLAGPEVAAPIASEVADVAAEPEERVAPESDRPDHEEREFAEVALTLSRLAVASTAFAADVAQRASESGEVSPQEQRQQASELKLAAAMPAIPLAPADASLAYPAPAAPPRRPRGGARGAASGAARHWAPRLALLTALGTATVVTPAVSSANVEVEVTPEPVALAADSALERLTKAPEAIVAAATVETPDAAEGPALTRAEVAEGEGAEVAAEVAAADAPADAAAETSSEDTANLLAVDQLAELRDTVVATRAQSRDSLPQCGSPDEAVPNGALAALDTAEYVTLSMPIQEGVYRVTSRFGPRWGSVHTGTDFAAPMNTPIHSVSSGKVIYSGGGFAGRSSYIIIVQSTVNGKPVQFWYNHMYADGLLVSEGETVEVGQTIAKVGSNGNSTGPHLHFEVHLTGQDPQTGGTMDSLVDGLDWLRANNATPITSSQVCA